MPQATKRALGSWAVQQLGERFLDAASAPRGFGVLRLAAFQRVEPRLVRGFEILDADHHLIHDAIDELAERRLASRVCQVLAAATGAAGVVTGSGSHQSSGTAPWGVGSG